MRSARRSATSYFNPRSPCGERREYKRGKPRTRKISIHAPRVGSDAMLELPCADEVTFQSTLPVWGATSTANAIVINSPDFNPRSPCGERLYSRQAATWTGKFQSTLPVWGATSRLREPCRIGRISIHAPRVGSDRHTRAWSCWTAPFQSTLPVWGAT